VRVQVLKQSKLAMHSIDHQSESIIGMITEVDQGIEGLKGSCGLGFGKDP